jgi:hypothetical protein
MRIEWAHPIFRIKRWSKKAMRRILLDNARRRKSQKHGSDGVFEVLRSVLQLLISAICRSLAAGRNSFRRSRLWENRLKPRFMGPQLFKAELGVMIGAVD